MKIAFDIEANRLVAPDRITLIVCKDLMTGQRTIFREVTKDLNEKERFLQYARHVDLWVGHNILGYDFPVLFALFGEFIEDVAAVCCDTLIISRMADYPRQKHPNTDAKKGPHSLEDYGNEFGFPKGDISDWSKWSQELEDYCIRDVDITEKVYRKYAKYINDSAHRASILTEHRFQLVVNSLHENGFAFNREKAERLLEKVTSQLADLDSVIANAFPPKLKLIREIEPKVTKHGTLSKADFRWESSGDLSQYNGGPFCRCEWVDFNPSSHKQLIGVLHEAGWSPVDKTQTHIDTEREYNRQKRSYGEINQLDLKNLSDKIRVHSKYGWKINETNLSTLPSSSPPAARSLAKRILLEARRRTLTEWLELVQPDGRIHGRFFGIGAWTHRMAHQEPNTANIPNEFDTEGKVKLLGKEMRQLWRAPKNRLLVGVDAEGIQLRIFAHYIDDPEFTEALIKGKKEDKSDPHSLNQRILGEACKSRAAAKRFIYALLLGGGIDKLAAILATDKSTAQQALDRLIQRYEGFATLKKTTIPHDAKRGWFIGLDGRKVRIVGETTGERKHLCMSGYLQNGEAVVMKLATLKWLDKLKTIEGLDFKLVNFVHDEWQTEVNNNMELALRVAQSQADALREVGEELKLKCPLAGSYWNDDHHDYTIGTNWYQTH